MHALRMHTRRISSLLQPNMLCCGPQLLCFTPRHTPLPQSTCRYVIHPGTYELDATLVVDPGLVCFIGTGPNRSTVVIAPGPAMPKRDRLLVQNSAQATPSTIVLAHLVVDGRTKVVNVGDGNAGVYGQNAVLEDVTIQHCLAVDHEPGTRYGGGLNVAQVTAVNCLFTGNAAVYGKRAGLGGAVYLRAGGSASFLQVG